MTKQATSQTQKQSFPNPFSTQLMSVYMRKPCISSHKSIYNSYKALKTQKIITKKWQIFPKYLMQNHHQNQKIVKVGIREPP